MKENATLDKGERSGRDIMPRFLQPLFALLASATDSQLAKMVEYLQAESKILRAKLPKRIPVTPRERNRLVKLGTALGGALKNIITIVSYRTFTRWIAGEKGNSKKTVTRKPGRPRTAEDLRELVHRLTRENNGWGYTRILGELKKLGITSVSRSTVVNILKGAGIDPGPQRGKGTWGEFVQRHTVTLWAADFLSVRSLTAAGFVELYLLLFIHVGSRRVIVSGPTANPDCAWVAQQARNASMQIAEWNLTADYLVIDRDSKFTDSFDTVFESEDAEVIRVGPRAPNLNPFAERMINTLKSECLNHFVICGERHLHHLVTSFLDHYHEERPHQGLGNVPLTEVGKSDDEPTVLPLLTGEIQCRTRLGGLLKHYTRDAA